jgi:hypothetical protein
MFKQVHMETGGGESERTERVTLDEVWVELRNGKS